MAKNVLGKHPPMNLPEPKTIKHMLEMAVNDAGNHIAYKFRGKDGVVEITYSQFQKDTIYLGTALNSMGLADGHIACVGENSYNWITVYLMALQSNGVFCPLDKELPENDFVNIITHGEDDIIFCDKRRENIFRNIRNSIPKVKYFICFDRDEDDGEFLSYSRLMEKGKALYESGDRAFANIEHTDTGILKMLIYTSGTTGISKGVMLSEHNLLSIVHWGMKLTSLRKVGISVLPYHHSYEAVAGLLPAIHLHITICINDSLKRVVKNMAMYQPYCMYAVPALLEVLYRRMNASIEEKGKTKTIKLAIKLSRFLRAIGIDKRRAIFKELHQALGGNLEKIIVGGAPIRSEIVRFFDDIGILVTNGYGITECSPLVAVNSDFINDPETVGFPMKCIDIRIDEPNEDGEGEICVKGDIVMLGYYKNPEATAEVFTEDGYFRTGDYGRMTKKGQLMITGRKKNMIILGNGKNIYPEELENYIGGISYVLENLVYGARDEDGKEDALAVECIIDPAFAEGISEEELQAKLKHDIFEALKDLPTYKQIKIVKVRKTPFVKTTTNKIKRAKDGSPL